MSHACVGMLNLRRARVSMAPNTVLKGAVLSPACPAFYESQEKTPGRANTARTRYLYFNGELNFAPMRLPLLAGEDQIGSIRLASHASC